MTPGNWGVTETDVKYVGNKVVIMSLDVPIDCTYDKLLSMIYSRTCIDKERFKLVLTCKYCNTPKHTLVVFNIFRVFYRYNLNFS